MADVANKAKVSVATVSRVLAEPDKVSLATRLRVEQVALELGYLPQQLQRNLRQQTSRNILVIAPDICNPFYHELIRGIETTAARRGYLVILGDCAHQDKQERSFIDLIITKEIMGVLLLGGQLPLHASREERRRLPPMVMANEISPELGLPSVHIDNLTAAYNAVNYLYELGHKRVACIAGPEEISLYQYRLQGYIQALTRNGQSVNPCYIARSELSYKAGARAAEKLLTLPKPPSALFCHNDMLAIGALSVAKRRGMRVPEELSIIGFDDIKLTEFCDPPLTTVAQPGFDIGREAMLLLIDSITGKFVHGGSHMLDSQLIVRGTTCPPLAEK